jgi:tetratricopeptide (TPR) repeat protein
LATVHFQSALELDGNDPLGHLELGNTLLQRNMPVEAAAQFRRSLAIDPGSVDARLALSKACVAQGDYGNAVAQLQQAVSLDPNNIRAVADLAWLLAVCPADDVRNGRRALELAQRACAVTRFRNPVLLNTLAAAHAETGDFAAAIAVADKALQLLGPQDAALATWIRQNVDLFRAGKPCRPPAGDSPP